MRTRNLVGGLTLPLALACLAGAPANPGATNRDLPETHKQGDVTYLTGGVGVSQEQAIRKHAGDYDLWVTLTAPDGSYLSGVDVTLEDGSGNAVLATKTDGPFLLAELPSGTYRIRATGADRGTQIRTVNVPDSGQARVYVALGKRG